MTTPSSETTYTCDAGNGVTMRLLRPNDAPELQRQTLANLDTLNPWLSPRDCYRDLQVAIDWINQNLDRFARDDGFHAGMFVEGRFIGLCGVGAIDRTNQVASLAYWISSEYGNRGIVTACASHICNHFFEQVGLHRLEIYCSTKNLPCRRVAEKLGFRHEATLRNRSRRPDGWHDELVYGMLVSDWQSLGGPVGVLNRRWHH